MTAQLPTRRLIPKWRPTSKTLTTNEAKNHPASTYSIKNDSQEEFEKVLSLWQETRDPGVMGDLLSFSVYPQFSAHVTGIGYKALQEGNFLTDVQTALIRELAHAHGQPSPILGSEELEGGHLSLPFRDPIRRLRSILRVQHGNPLALLDYAQLMAAIGKTKGAMRSINTALTLAPNNRIVLRTAARFYVHTGQRDQAHWLIKKHPRTLTDPWLMASEIALSDASQKDSLMIGRGKRFLLDQKNSPPQNTTELAGAIAMKEMAAGNLKKAREAQRRALLSPNDNVAAQAVQLEREFGIDLREKSIDAAILNSCEAKVLNSWFHGSPDETIKNAIEWHNEEPFSSRPVQLLGFIYSYQGNHNKALLWLKAGLLADPTDVGLLRNLAFAQTLQKDYISAKLTINKVKSITNNINEPFIAATEGLAEYQKGNFSLGDNLYRSASENFTKSRDFGNNSFCLLNQAYFAIASNHPSAEIIIERAKDALGKYMSYDCAMLIKIHKYSQIETPEQVEIGTRRLKQWIFDPTSNKLIEHQGVTSVNAPSVVLAKSATSNKQPPFRKN